MRNYKIILFLCFFTLVSCGKSPIFNKIGKTVNVISGGVLYSEQSANNHFNFSYKWIVAPTLSDLSSFELTLSQPLPANQSLNVYIWMPEMGHGSSPISVLQINSTDYIFNELAFIMPGLWVLHIEVLENNQVIDQWQKPFTL